MGCVKHIVVFKGRLVTLDFFMDCVIDYMKDNDIDYYLVDTNIPETYNSPRFDEYIAQEGCVMFTFNNVGVRLDEGGVNLWKKRNIPVYNFIVDPPRAFPEILTNPDCDMYVFSLDENRNDFIREFYPEIKDVYFIPAGGADVNSGKPLKDRSIDVIYMGNCQSKDITYPEIYFLDDKGVDLYQNVIQYMVKHTDITTEHAIKKYLQHSPVKLTKEQLLYIMTHAGKPIEETVRRVFKQAGMQALDRAGVHVDIWGTGWEDDDYTYSDNIRFHERITPGELLNYVGDSKISLVYMGWQKRGCSEKNFDSMLNGAVCVSDRSDYLLKHYVDGKNIVYFDMNNPEQMAADIKYLLEHLDRAQEIATDGYNTAKEFDDWNVRCREMFRIMCENQN